MIVAIRDRATLLGVPPIRVATYLQSKGWNRVSVEPNRYSLWMQPDAPNELLLPLATNLGDFAERMAELLSDLQKYEERSQLDILRDIETSSCDLFRFRKDPHSGFLGAIGIEEGVRLVGYARDMLLYAASAEHEPKAVVTGRRSVEVENFMAQALLGQTEVSSFVVTAQIPVPARLNGELFPDSVPASAEPFERRAGLRLMRLLQKTREAAVEASQTNNFSPFHDVLGEGASFNLYSALVEAQGIIPGEPLEISAAWAPSRPRVGAPVADVVIFGPEIIPPIRAAVDSLRPQAPKVGVPVFGFVELLQRETQELLMGTLAVKTVIEGRERKVLLNLEKPEYEMAITAFKDKRPIEVTGDLVKISNRWVLKNPRNLVLHLGETSTVTDEESSPGGAQGAAGDERRNVTESA